ncbi:MAG TPA: enoyl-CoA hydratase-related protein [Geobacteraceae bacterium]|nr:enoyl-CoA hydratase-related protein [Geobacteraceae bacterium]
MGFKNVLTENTDGVATLTVNRPQSLNALNGEVLAELECIVHGLERDAAVKAVILTGSGDKAFVAGADIKEMAEMNSYEGHAFALKGQRVMLAIEKMKKPVIAAVNGYALGGGLELALACDFIYASEKAKVGFPEVTLGIMPGFGGTQNLARLIGPNRANELIFTGRVIDASKACAWGIVNEVVAPEELLARSRETAATIARAGLLGVAYAKDAIANGLNMGKEDGFRYEASLFGVLFATEDQKEGMRAFMAKRKAGFSNR